MSSNASTLGGNGFRHKVRNALSNTHTTNSPSTSQVGTTKKVTSRPAPNTAAKTSSGTSNVGSSTQQNPVQQNQKAPEQEPPATFRQLIEFTKANETNFSPRQYWFEYQKQMRTAVVQKSARHTSKVDEVNPQTVVFSQSYNQRIVIDPIRVHKAALKAVEEHFKSGSRSQVGFYLADLWGSCGWTVMGTWEKLPNGVLVNPTAEELRRLLCEYKDFDQWVRNTAKIPGLDRHASIVDYWLYREHPKSVLQMFKEFSVPGGSVQIDCALHQPDHEKSKYPPLCSNSDREVVLIDMKKYSGSSAGLRFYHKMCGELGEKEFNSDYDRCLIVHGSFTVFRPQYVFKVQPQLTEEMVASLLSQSHNKGFRRG